MINFPFEIGPGQPVNGPLRIVSARLQAQDNPTEYSNYDVIGDGYIVFANAVRSPGGAGMILHAEINLDFIPTGTFDVSLWLFKTKPIEQEDNYGFVKVNSMLNNLLTVIRLSTLMENSAEVIKQGVNDTVPAVVYGNSCCGLNRGVICEPDSMNIYGVLVANDAFLPESRGTYNINLHIMA